MPTRLRIPLAAGALASTNIIPNGIHSDVHGLTIGPDPSRLARVNSFQPTSPAQVRETIAVILDLP